MSAVKRLGVCGPIYECDDGKYVLACDYDALLQHLEAAETQIGLLKEENEQLCTDYEVLRDQYEMLIRSLP